jgi:phage-related protein
MLGIAGIVAGVIVLVWPGISVMMLAWVSGIFLIVDAIFDFVAALRRSTEGRGLLALLGVLSLIAGLFLVRHPIAGVVAMALLLGFWLIVFGVVRFVEPSCAHRDRILNAAAATIP